MVVSLKAGTAEKLQASLDEGITKGTPPLILKVVSSQGLLAEAQAGKSAIDGTGPSVTGDETVNLWSMTKAITSFAALQLVDQKKLDLKAPIGPFLPQFPSLTAPHKILVSYDKEPELVEAKNVITVEQLLNHTSGLTYPTNPIFLKWYHLHGIGYMPSFPENGLEPPPLLFEPGTSYGYGPSLDYLGLIIEKVSGLSLEEYFQKEILKPLGMDSTSFFCNPEIRSRLIPTRYRDPTTREAVPNTVIPGIELEPSKVRYFMGGAGLHGTAGDYSKFVSHILSILDGNAVVPLLSLETTKLMFSRTLTPLGQQQLDLQSPSASQDAVGVGAGSDGDKASVIDQFGFGLRNNVVDKPGGRKTGSGWWSGFANTFFFIDPTTGIAVVFCSQIVPSSDPAVKDVYSQIENIIYANLE